jgi:hypothetical protein
MAVTCGSTPKQAIASPPAASVPVPNGCTPTARPTWINGSRLLVMTAAASPIAAPSAPYLGINAMSRTTVTASAIRTLQRFQRVRPAIASTMSTIPQPVANSIALARTTTTAAPSR